MPDDNPNLNLADAAAEPAEPAEPEIFDWTVGFYGPFRVTTRLKHEKEIDIDDRAVILVITVEMLPPGHLDLVARNVRIRLDFDFSERKNDQGAVVKPRDNILFHGKEKGPLWIAGGEGDEPVEIAPEAPFVKEITISTGLFSSLATPKDADSAEPGRKVVDVTIEYELEPRNPLEPHRTTTTATMRMRVARD